LLAQREAVWSGFFHNYLIWPWQPEGLVLSQMLAHLFGSNIFDQQVRPLFFWGAQLLVIWVLISPSRVLALPLDGPSKKIRTHGVYSSSNNLSNFNLSKLDL
jgi:hypothetical protein